MADAARARAARLVDSLMVWDYCDGGGDCWLFCCNDMQNQVDEEGKKVKLGKIGEECGWFCLCD